MGTNERSEKGDALRVVVAAASRLRAELLGAALDGQPGVACVGVALNGTEADDLVDYERPDVLVAEQSLKRRNGVQLARTIARRGGETATVLLFEAYDSKRMADAYDAGVRGIVTAGSSVADLVSAIRAAVAGEQFVPDRFDSDLERERRRRPELRLTARQTEVLQLVAEGNTTRKIAAQLFISVKTVETHRRHISEKLGIHSVAGLTRYAVREGICSLDD